MNLCLKSAVTEDIGVILPSSSMDSLDNTSLPAIGTGDNPSPGVERILPATFMGILIVITFQGNLWILVAIFMNPLLRTSSSSIFVINLMVLGLLASCIALPLSMVIFIRDSTDFNATLCNVSGFFNSCLMMCSMLHLSLISIDRFYSIMSPMHHAAHATPGLYGVLAFLTWALSGGLSLLPLPGVVQVKGPRGFPDKESYCTFTIPRSKTDEVFIFIVVVISFFLPSLIIISMYTGVFFMARKAAHTVLPRPTPSTSRTLRFQLPHTDQINATTNHARAEATVQSDESQRREVSALILIPNSSSTESIGHQLFNGAVPSRDRKEKTVGYPTAKVSPTNLRQTFPPQRPKATDPSIFCVAAHTVPEVSAVDRRNFNSRNSQTPEFHNMCPTGQCRNSFARQRERIDRRETRKSDRSYTIQYRTAVPKARNSIGFVCGCASRPGSGHQAPDRRKSKSKASTSGRSSLTTRKPLNWRGLEVEGTGRSATKHDQSYAHSRYRPSYAKAFRTVMIIVLSYFVFWSLYFVCQIHILYYGLDWPKAVYIFAIWLGFASYGVNPYLYGCMNRQIREEVTGIFKDLRKRGKYCCCCCFWAFYRRCITPQPSHADSLWACCVPPREPSNDSNEDNMNGQTQADESFFQFLQRTQDGDTPVPPGVFQSESI